MSCLRLENNDTTKNIQPFLEGLLEIDISDSWISEKEIQICGLVDTLQKANKIAWLLKSINMIDLTTLNGNDTASTVENLCKKAVCPIKLKSPSDTSICTAAVCIYPARIQDALDSLKSLDARQKISIASVAGGFPSGQYPLHTRLSEIKFVAESGIEEVDVVINRPLALAHKWKELYDELKEMRTASNKLRMKTILATGELLYAKDIYKASMVAMMAGSDFIKTSTGKEAINAVLSAGIVMCLAIKNFYMATGRKVGFKPAGGIKVAKDVLMWMTLVKEMLGDEWLNKDLFRIGASSLLDDVVAEIQSME